jgi:hypothetical protein
MPNIDKADRRDNQREKKRRGMRVHGKNINIILRAQEKRDRERLERRERRERTDSDDTR